MAETPGETFERLLADHGPALRALVGRLCRSREDAEDVWQDAAARIWRSLHRRPRLTSPRGWLGAVCYRAYLDHAARRPRESPCGECPERADRSGHSPPDAAVLAEARVRVNDALAALPEELRALVALHYTAGLSLRQCAAALGVPAGTAKIRLHAALNRLREELR